MMNENPVVIVLIIYFESIALKVVDCLVNGECSGVIFDFKR